MLEDQLCIFQQAIVVVGVKANNGVNRTLGPSVLALLEPELSNILGEELG